MWRAARAPWRRATAVAVPPTVALPHASPLTAVAIGLTQGSGRCLSSARATATVLGIVDTVTGDNIVARSMRASPLSLATFQRGASGLVTDISQDTAYITLIHGAVSPAQTVAAELRPASLLVSSALMGRVLGVLGDPLDGLGPIPHPPTARPQPLLSSDPPGITARARASNALPSGSKAVDAFYPLLRGSSSVVTGEAGTGAGAFAERVVAHIGRANDEALEGEGWVEGVEEAHPVVCVYVTVGSSVSGVQDLVRRLESYGALRHTIVVAAPNTASVGSAFLAPFTGAAIGEYFRDTGRHALVVYDDLTAHHAAARRVSRMSWGKTAAVATGHASLFERCAQLSPERGGGSLTCVALLEAVPSGPAYVQLEHMKGREMVANTASLADNRIHLTRNAVKAGALLPLNFEEVVGRPGHAALGPAMQYYVNRAREVMSEVRETARGASLAQKLGVSLESEGDSLLDLHAKMRLLLLPTQHMLQVIGDARASATDVPMEAVGRLGLEGLTYVVVEGGDGGSTGGGGGAQGHPTSKAADATTLATVTSMLAAKESAAVSRAKGGQAKGGQASRGYHTSAQCLADGPKDDAPGGIHQRIQKLKAKMDNEQLRTLTAVQHARAQRPVKNGLSAAEAYFAAQRAGMGAGLAAAEAVRREQDGMLDAGTEAAGEKTYDSIDDVPEEEEEEAGKVACGARTSPAPGPSTGGTPAWWGALSGKPPGSRSFSTAAGGGGSPTGAVGDDTASPGAPSRSPFRAPTGRTPPPPLFTLPRVVSDVRDGVASGDARNPLPAAWHSWQWLDGPHAGDPTRTLLTLFLLSHGYVARVPLPYVLSYERGLYELLTVLPAPGASGEEGVRALVQRGRERGLLHTPMASLRAGYPTLLDAALTADVPASMFQAPMPDIGGSLREGALGVVRRAAAAAAEEARARAAGVAASEAARRADSSKTGSTTGGIARSFATLFQWKSPPKLAVQGEPPASAPVADAGTAPPPSSEPCPALSLSSLEPYLRVQGVLGELPPVWQAMHVSCAEFTRAFVGDPKL